MRNKYPGICYRCGKMVAKGDGHFERIPGARRGQRWRTQHAQCAINARIAKELREALAAAAEKKLEATDGNQQERSLFEGEI